MTKQELAVIRAKEDSLRTLVMNLAAKNDIEKIEALADDLEKMARDAESRGLSVAQGRLLALSTFARNTVTRISQAA